MADGNDMVRLRNAEEQQKDALLPTSTDKTKKVPTGRVTGPLFFAVFSATVGGSFQFGYNIGCVNTPGSLIQKWYNESYRHLYNEEMSLSNNQFAWSLSVAIFAIGGMFGGLLSGWCADKLGRKRALLANNILALLGVLLMTSAKYINIYYAMIVGRLVIGLNSGLNSGLVPMYVTEIAPINLRGAIGSICQLLVTISISISQIISHPYMFSTEEYWPFIFAFAILPIVVMFTCLPLCPESPNYTLIVKNDKDQAEIDLKKLRNTEDVTAELELIDEEAKASRNQAKVTFLDMLGPTLRWPLFIAIMMMLAQQLSGINAIMFYSTRIFEQAGLTDIASSNATIAIGAINVVQTVVSVWLVEHPKSGRRPLMLVGMVCMLFSSICIVGSLTLASWGSKSIDGKTVMVSYQWAPYLSVVFVLLFVVAFATGPGSIPWFYVSEIFPSNARGNANSLACMANWTANFLVAIFFVILTSYLMHFTFLVFAGFLTFFIVFTYFFVPETKNKTVEEINREMYKTGISSSNVNNYQEA